MAGISTVLGSNQTFSGSLDADTVTAQSNDTVSGFDGNDSLSFTGNGDTINGNIGNDAILGVGETATSDSLFGGQGDDTIFAYVTSSLISGDIGADSISFDGNFDTVSGGLGNDTIFDSDSDARGLTLLGGQGDDSIYTFSTSSFVSGDIGNDTLKAIGSFETITGGDGDDTIFAEGANSPGKGDTINGNLGNDTIFAQSLIDSSIRGGQGDDEMAGVDVFANKIYGDLGNDSIELEESGLVDPAFGSNFVNGNGGDDTIAGVSTLNDTIHGGQDDDVLVLAGSGVGSFNSILFGDIGDDNLIAERSGFGNDVSAQVGENTLVGGDGDDRLFSTGNSNVIMTGDGTGSTDPGADLFYVQGRGIADTLAGAEHESTVTDFVSGVDHLSFDSIAGTGANFTATAAEVTTIEAAGSAAAAVKHTGSLYVFVAGATDGYLFYDGSGTASADSFNAEITLVGKNDISDVSFNDIVSVTASSLPGSF